VTPKSSEQQRGPTLFELFSPGSFLNIQRTLEQGEFVDARELALVLRENPGKVLPDPIRDYMIRWLEGKVKRPRGRQRGSPLQEARNAYASVLYREYLETFQRETKESGKPSRSGKRPRAPHLRAAERVARELFPNHTAAYVLNLVSRSG
jgi:hypothetical protein